MSHLLLSAFFLNNFIRIFISELSLGLGSSCEVVHLKHFQDAVSKGKKWAEMKQIQLNVLLSKLKHSNNN